MSGWQPIETAPKTGLRILLYQPIGDGEDRDRTVAEGAWGIHGHGPACWCMEAGDGWIAPTHWRKLPEPPA